MKQLILALCLAWSWRGHGGELADQHSKEAVNRTAHPSKSRSHAEVESTNHGITEIGIERTTCLGVCPAYTFIVKSDGSFRYKGEQFVKRSGEFTGKVQVGKFNALAQFIHDSEYANLESAYRRRIADNPTVYTMVVIDGKRKVISNYANAGPTKLWAIEQLIDELMARAEWKRSPMVEKKKK